MTRETLKTMLERVREFAPTIVNELKPDIIRMGTLPRGSQATRGGSCFAARICR